MGRSEIKAAPCHETGVVPGQARSADVRPHGVDRAGCGYADNANEGSTAIATASHAPSFVIDIDTGD
jgi:hypothetical protein